MALRVDDVDLVRDRALVERFQEGDPAAFETLYRRYFSRLSRFCQKRVGDPHEAEEIAQEAFTRALRALPNFEGERRFYPWMTVIAGRLCVDAHRRRGRSEPSPTVDLGVIEGGQERIVDAVDVQILSTAIGRIAARHREVLDLREQQGWSYQQIADHYGVTLGTVEALLFRARKALRREFMAVVGGDQNWAALPVLGLLGSRVAAVKAKIEAWMTALPSLSGPAVAAAMAVTAVTGAAVGAGVLHGNHASPPAAAVATVGAAPAAATSLPELLDGLPADQGHPDTALARPAVAPEPTDASGSESPEGLPLASPRADTQAVDVVGAEEADENSRRQPVWNEVEGIFVGADPESASSETARRVGGYASEVVGVEK